LTQNVNSGDTGPVGGLSGRIIDPNVKEMPKNPFDFIWESENLLARKLPAPPPPVQTEALSDQPINQEDSTVFQSSHHELANVHTLSATTLETSIANTTANDITATNGKSNYKKSSSKKTKSSKSSSRNKPSKDDNEKIFLVDEFNKQQHVSSTSNISGVDLSTQLTNNNSCDKPAINTTNDKKLTKIDNSS